VVLVATDCKDGAHRLCQRIKGGTAAEGGGYWELCV